MEQIVTLHRSFSLAFLPKHQIYPRVEIVCYCLRLQSHPHLEDELLRSFCPLWEDNIIHLLPFLLLPQKELISILEKLWPIVELRY